VSRGIDIAGAVALLALLVLIVVLRCVMRIPDMDGIDG